MIDDKNNYTDDYSLENILEEARHKKLEREKKLSVLTNDNEHTTKKSTEKTKQPVNVFIKKDAANPTVTNKTTNKFELNSASIKANEGAAINKNLSDKPKSVHDTSRAPVADITEQFKIKNIEKKNTAENESFDNNIDTQEPNDFDTIGFKGNKIKRRNPHALTPEELLGKKVKSEKNNDTTLASTIRMAALKAEKIIKRDFNNEIDKPKIEQNKKESENKEPKKRADVIQMRPQVELDESDNVAPIVDSTISSNYSVDDLKNRVTMQIDRALLNAELAKREALDKTNASKRFKISDTHEEKSENTTDYVAEKLETESKMNKIIDEFIAKPVNKSRSSDLRGDPNYPTTKLKSVEQYDNVTLPNSSIIGSSETPPTEKVKIEHIDYTPLKTKKNLDDVITQEIVEKAEPETKQPENNVATIDFQKLSKKLLNTHVDEITESDINEISLSLGDIDSDGNILMADTPSTAPSGDAFTIKMMPDDENSELPKAGTHEKQRPVLENMSNHQSESENNYDLYVAAYPQRPVAPIKEAMTMTAAIEIINENGYTQPSPPYKTVISVVPDLSPAGDEVDNDDSEITGQEKLAIKKVTKLNDYEKLDDSRSIRSGLERKKKSALYAAISSISVTSIFAILQILFEFNVRIIFVKERTVGNAQFNLVVMLIFLVVVSLCNLKIFPDIAKLLKMEANNNSAAALVSAVVVVHGIILISNPDLYFTGSAKSYALLGCFALTINAIGNLVYASNVRENFEIIANESLKRSAFMINDKDTAISLATGTVVGQPQIIATGKTVNHRRFLRDAYSQDPTNALCSKLTPLSLVFAFGFSIMLYTMNGDFVTVAGFFTISVILINPLFSSLLASLPIATANAHLRQKGTIITGYRSIEKISKSNAVAVDAQDLFPIGSVKIFSIQTFGNHKIDEVLLEAAGVAIKGGGSLADVFDQVIQGHYQMLPYVDELIYEEGKGAVGHVVDKEILVGNRELMQMYNISLPDAQVEADIRLDNKYPIYLASGGEMCAMFVVAYETNERVYESVYRIVKEGNMLLVRTVDPNIDKAMICTKFDISSDSVHVMNSDGAETFKQITRLADRTGGIVTKGSTIQAINAVSTSINIFQNIKISILIQVLFCLLGFGAFVALNVTGRFTTFAYSLIPLLIFQLLAGITALSVSIFRRDTP